MSKIGLIYCGFNTEEYIEKSLRPWIEARQNHLVGNDYMLCAVSVPFEGFDVGACDNTHTQLYQHLQNGEIDHLITSDKPMKETEARGAALKWLVAQGVETLVQWDSDELATTDQIAKILSFIAANPFTDCFRFSYKNLVFTENQYLAEPFTPMRAHRVKSGSYVADSFYDDNNVLYRGTITRDFKRDIDRVVKTIPKSLVWIKHATWISNERSHKKVLYQQARNWKCSFSWDDAQGGLIFNPALPAPEIARDEA